MDTKNWPAGRARTAASTLMALTLVAVLLPACGAQDGRVEGQVLGMYAADQQPKIVSGATVQVAGSHGDQRPVVTGGDGKFALTLPYDNYDVLASADGLQPREKTLQINSSQVETVGFVLVAPGIQQPQSPPPITPADRQALSSGSAFTGGPGIGSGVFSDPWFWFWMFDRPYMFGYPRMPFAGYGGFGGPSVLVIDHRTDPLIQSNQRGYASYRDPAGPPVAGTKPAPQPVAVATGSKGVTKPSTGGSSALTAPRGPAPVAPPSRSSGSTVGGSNSGSRSAGSASRPAPVTPPSRGSVSRSPSRGGGSKGRR